MKGNPVTDRPKCYKPMTDSELYDALEELMEQDPKCYKPMTDSELYDALEELMEQDPQTTVRADVIRLPLEDGTPAYSVRITDKLLTVYLECMTQKAADNLRDAIKTYATDFSVEN